MQNLDLWFALAVLVYIGAIAGMWRFWHPGDPVARRSERAASDMRRTGVPDRPFLLDGEVLVQKATASYYANRADTQWVAGGAPLAGAGFVAGFRRNRPGYSYQETGTLWLTDQRLVFLGPGMSLNLPLSDILQVEGDERWLMIWTNRNAHSLRWRLREADVWRGTLLDQLTAGTRTA